MTEKTIGFIGAGNMGGAMIGGICNSGLILPNQIIASDYFDTALEKLHSAYGIRTTHSNEEVASTSDILFLAIKPNKFAEVLPAIASCIKSDGIVVSIAAGQSIGSVEFLLGSDKKIVRAMPNTTALVSESMSALCCNLHVSDSELAMVKQLFECFGKAEIVTENMIDAVVGVSGSSPAYVYMFIEAMADAAVADGMPRAMAYKFAAQSVLGAAKMVLETGRHPGDLKDMVCSPGGTTIEAVASLEACGFRNAVITAQRACVQKSKDMTTKN
ncbi:MAG: pyrroline-5-carboxylate reductase [Lachnospiraceae bacterium]|nr:pyrroline-5-carboxylate reductase [Lachnospiraceae bacterium]